MGEAEQHYEVVAEGRLLRLIISWQQTPQGQADQLSDEKGFRKLWPLEG